MVDKKLATVKASADDAKEQFQESYRKQNELLRQRFQMLEERLQQIDVDLREQTRHRVREIAAIYDHFEGVFGDISKEVQVELQKIDAENEEAFQNIDQQVKEYEQKIDQEQAELEKDQKAFTEETQAKI